MMMMMKQSVSVMMMMMMMGSPASSFRLADTRVPVQRVPNSCVTQSGSNCVVSQVSGCQQETITVPSCTTDSGPQASQACIFPFRYNGVVYTSCTSVDQAAAWCATQVDAGGNFVTDQYGFCPSTCPSTSSSATTTTTTTTTTTSAA